MARPWNPGPSHGHHRHGNVPSHPAGASVGGEEAGPAVRLMTGDCCFLARLWTTPPPTPPSPRVFPTTVQTGAGWFCREVSSPQGQQWPWL